MVTFVLVQGYNQISCIGGKTYHSRDQEGSMNKCSMEVQGSVFFWRDFTLFFIHRTCNKEGINLCALVNHRIGMRQWYAVSVSCRTHEEKQFYQGWRGLNAALQATDTVLVHCCGQP